MKPLAELAQDREAATVTLWPPVGCAVCRIVGTFWCLRHNPDEANAVAASVGTDLAGWPLRDGPEGA